MHKQNNFYYAYTRSKIQYDIDVYGYMVEPLAQC